MTATPQVRICVPVCEANTRDLIDAFARAAKVADIVELRLDYLDENELQLAGPAISNLISISPCPIIITYRPAEQGGHGNISLQERQSFIQRFRAEGSSGESTHYIDIESDLAVLLQAGGGTFNEGTGQDLDWNKVICSHHDFAGVPQDLERIYNLIASTPARVLKIAVQADDVTDCLAVFKLLARARDDGREMIAIAMGPAGLATRILGPSRGSFLTYASLDSDHGTAPGQVTASEMRELYRVGKIDRETQITGLVGFPVTHSVSPAIHNAALKSTGVNGVYMPFPVRELGSFVRRMIHPRTREIDWRMRGLSITTPHKAKVMNFLDWIDDGAKEIGAVNTVVVEGDALHGYNTDAAAFLQVLVENFGTLRDANCAVLGSGGAAAAVLWGLEKKGARVTVFARDRRKAETLAKRFGASDAALDSARFAAFDVVINCTTLGMSGSLEKETPATAAQLRGARLAYDLVYNPAETRFLNEAGAAGCKTVGGLSMLIAQAAEQYTLWTGLQAPKQLMTQFALRALQGE